MARQATGQRIEFGNRFKTNDFHIPVCWDFLGLASENFAACSLIKIEEKLIATSSDTLRRDVKAKRVASSFDNRRRLKEPFKLVQNLECG